MLYIKTKTGVDFQEIVSLRKL